MGSSQSVQVMLTCLIDTFFPKVAQAVLASLKIAGYEINLNPRQTCCGQPAFNAGFWDEARKMAGHTIEVFEGSPDPIVIPSGSCTHMIRHGYPMLFQDNPTWLARAQAHANKTYEWSEFLVHQAGVTSTKNHYSGNIAYHASCHLTRGIGVKDAPMQMLNGLTSGKVVPLPEECCGFGGVFAVEQPELSMAMVDRKIDAIHASRADFVAGCDVSCLMQIEGRLRRTGSNVRCVHLSQLLFDQTPGLG